VKDFEVKMRFEDSKLTAAIVEALISMKASQAAINALLLEDIARRSRKDLDEVSDLYDRLVEDYKLKYLADLELNYSDSDLAPPQDS